MVFIRDRNRVAQCLGPAITWKELVKFQTEAQSSDIPISNRNVTQSKKDFKLEMNLDQMGHDDGSSVFFYPIVRMKKKKGLKRNK